MTPRLAILIHDAGSRSDGIRDHALRLADALATDVDVTVHAQVPGGWIEASADSAPRALPLVDAVLLAYNPFAFGRWGFAPGLVEQWRKLGSRSAPPRRGLLVHEPFVPIVGGKSLAMGAWQRLQLRLLARTSDVAFGTVEAWVPMIHRASPKLPAHHLPVGSNVPDGRARRNDLRQRLGVAPDTPVLAALSTGHASRLDSFATAAVNAVAAAGLAPVFLNLGDGAPALPDVDSHVIVHAPGRLPADDLAAWLSAADLFLAPFVDGVSTRRTSIMAAFNNAVAVVGTDGPLTDRLLRDATNAIVLTPPRTPVPFAEAAVKLVHDASRRRSIAASGHALYVAEFDWPVVADRVRRHLLDERAGHPRKNEPRPQ